jgi:hypothetical protein
MSVPALDGANLRQDIKEAIAGAYGDLRNPSYRFAPERYEGGMHRDVIRAIASRFDVDDQTSLGSDDVCISLIVRRTSSSGEFRWNVRISLVGNYAIVSDRNNPSRPWPLTSAPPGTYEATLQAVLRDAGMELLEYLAVPTALRPPNSEPFEVYSVYNGLFSDGNPFPA